MVKVAAELLQVAFPAQLLQVFAAGLERVAAVAGVEEVGRRDVVLLAVAIELPDLVGAFHHRAAGVAPFEVGVGVGDEREVVAEVAIARFEVHLVAQRAVPLGLVDPAAGILLVGLARIRVGVGRERQAVGLFLLAPLEVADQLVLRVGLIGPLGDRVPQPRIERLVEREVRLRHLVLLIAIGEEPPHLVLLHRPADVDVGVVVAGDFVGVRTNRRVVERRRRRVRMPGCSSPAGELLYQST